MLISLQIAAHLRLLQHPPQILIEFLSFPTFSNKYEARIQILYFPMAVNTLNSSQRHFCLHCYFQEQYGSGCLIRWICMAVSLDSCRLDKLHICLLITLVSLSVICHRTGDSPCWVLMLTRALFGYVF